MKNKTRSTFEVKGTITDKQNQKPFTKTVQAFSQQNAQEKTMMLFGSKNRIKRRNITIESIKAVKGE